MKNKLLNTLIISILIQFILISHCLAYSDDLVKFDMPSTYANVSYSTMRIFSDTQNEDRCFIIYAINDMQIKKSVWELTTSDINNIFAKSSSSNKIISIEKKSKLGKEKSIKVISTDNKFYMESHILASNKYIYMVVFSGKSLEDLNNSDYMMIKKTFKLKDPTFNYRAIYITLVLAGIGFSLFKKFRNITKDIPYNPIENIDYKNLTEDDLKK